MTIGQRVKIRREELGMSQEELAKKIGYKSKSSINKIELGFRVLTQSKIKAIADALDTTPSYIMGWDEEASRNEWASKFRDSVMQILNNADSADLEAAGISVQEIEEELSGSDSISLVTACAIADELGESHEMDATNWFLNHHYLKSYNSPYDCTGQEFTNWFYLFRRRGHWFAYHSVSRDV